MSNTLLGLLRSLSPQLFGKCMTLVVRRSWSELGIRYRRHIVNIIGSDIY